MNRIKTKGYANLTREAYIMYYFCNRTCVASVDDFLNLLNTQIKLDFNSFKKSQIILLEDDFDYFILDCNIWKIQCKMPPKTKKILPPENIQ